MIDIESCSYEELIVLEMQIRKQMAELRKQDITKDKLKENAIDFFVKHYPLEVYGGNNIPFSASQPGLYVSRIALESWQKTTDALTKLCGIAMKNYRLKKDTKSNGTVIYRNLRFNSVIPNHLSKRYEEMYTELWNVFSKYTEMEPIDVKELNKEDSND